MSKLGSTVAPRFPMPDGLVAVLGGSGGIGRAICIQLAESGADIALSWRKNSDAAEAIVQEVRALGCNATAEQADLADAASVDAFFAALAETERPIAAVIVATGADISLDYFGSVDPAEWRDVIDGDLNGFFNVAQAALPHLRKSSGNIVALTSAGIARHAQLDILSIAPKAGIETIIRAVAREEGRSGVRANAIALGPIEAGLLHRLEERAPDGFMEATERNTALRRSGTAQEAANAAVFLASDAASYITGVSLAVDGGYSV